MMEHNTLQSEAGYIDARPHLPGWRNLLQRAAGPYIRVIHVGWTISASLPLFPESGGIANIAAFRVCANCCSPSLTLTERCDGAREGCSRPALSQPDVFVRAHLRETQEMVFDDNDRAFTHHVRTASRGSFGRHIRAGCAGEPRTGLLSHVI